MDYASALLLPLIILVVPPLREVFFPVRAAGADESLAAVRGVRLPHLDALKGFAMLAVVVIHALWPLAGKPSVAGVGDATVSVLNNAVRFAIPLFLIASGVLLSLLPPRTGELMRFFRQRLARIALPYALVTVAMGISMGTAAIVILRNLVTGTAQEPYYFVPVILQCYALFPLLYRFRASRAFLFGTLFLSLVCMIVPYFWGIFGVPFVGAYLFFFYYGVHYASRIAAGSFGRREVAAAVAVIVAYLLLMAYQLDYYYNFRPGYGLAVLFLFVAGKEALLRRPNLTRFLSRVGKDSLWVFLLHFPLVVGIYRMVSPAPGPLFGYELALVVMLSLVGSVSLGLLVAVAYNRLMGFMRPTHLSTSRSTP